MKCFFCMLIACLLFFSSCSEKLTRTGAGAKQLKVLTYNIHHGNPPSKKDVIDLDAIANVIKREDPDVVAMQELDKMVSRSGGIDEAKIIAEKVNMNYHFFKSIDYDGGEYGIAIFSKMKLKNPKQIILPKAKEQAETRTMGYVEIAIAGGQKLIFACTHLGVEGDESRLMQVEAIKNELGKTALPVILCGDLNCSVGSEPIKLLLQEFRNSCTENCGFTIPANKPYRNIDFIVSRNVAWPVSDYHVVDEEYASDHRPVAAVYNIANNTNR